MTPQDLEASNIPQSVWRTELSTLDAASKFPHQNWEEFYDWLVSPSPLLTIMGPSMSGKTTLAGAIARYWVDVGTRILDIPDTASPMLWTEFRLYWADAALLMPAYHHSVVFQDEANYDNILPKTNMLFLDNLDDVDAKYIPEVVALVRGRIDAGRMTVLLVRSQATGLKFGAGIAARVEKGRRVKLDSRA
jgi:hypothetical protein